MSGRVYTINEISSIVEPIARSYGVERLALFGSYARGDATSDSDIDLRIVDKGSLRGLFRLAGFQRELEEKLAVSVDVLPTDALDSEFLAHIQGEEVILFEQQPAQRRYPAQNHPVL